MKQRRQTGNSATLAFALALAACASQGERIERSQHVGQRMLAPVEKQGDAAGITPTWEKGPNQVFRYPEPIDNTLPSLPPGSGRTNLAGTTVCVRFEIAETGAVRRVDALDDRAECQVGALPENADLMQAVRGRLLQWTFVPFAICTWPPERYAHLDADGGCSGAEKIEPQPVTLLYAFTFEIREGKVMVSRSRR